MNKLFTLNEEMRHYEFRLRKALFRILDFKETQLYDGVIDDFEYEFQYSLYSNNIEFCKIKGVSKGDPF